ncbi:hypothetical protein NOF04DRAFT_1308048 [Fusarium oxysporum II5]|nr:hypothetical protein NOF04DRAFT_1308048 [Fusarium oxysporum II5]
MIPPATHETVCCANSLHCISLVSFFWNCLLCFMPSLHISLLIPKLDWSYRYRVGLRKYTSTPLGTRNLFIYVGYFGGDDGCCITLLSFADAYLGTYGWRILTLRYP